MSVSTARKSVCLLVSAAALGVVAVAPPATADDPTLCDFHGRPDPNGSTDRVLRGYIVGWAVNTSDEQVRWNHLSSSVTCVNYRDRSAFEYNGWAVPVVDPAIVHGQPVGEPGFLELDGVEYAQSFSHVLMHFNAVNSVALSTPQSMVTPDPFLTLHPTSADLRHGVGVPITTKAEIFVWNENRNKLSGSYQCVTCWNSRLLSLYGVPNHFTVTALQSDFGTARIQGVEGTLCENSEETALLGMFGRQLSFDDVAYGGSATNLIGMGYRSAHLRYSPVEPPPESMEPPAEPEPLRGVFRMVEFPEDPAGQAPLVGPGWGINERSAVPEGDLDGVGHEDKAEIIQAGGPVVPDRVSSTEKGSLIILSHIELRWDDENNLVQDCFVNISNDHPDDTQIKFYFINGDPPLEGDSCERDHPGWNTLNNKIWITGNQPIWWSVLTGEPQGMSPFEVLDPAPQ